MEVRSAASSSIRYLSLKMGLESAEMHFAFIRSKVECPPAQMHSLERLGYQQAFAVFMCSFGLKYFKEQMELVLERISSDVPPLRDAYVGIFIYLIPMLGERLGPFVRKVVHALDHCLMDESTSIRDSALKAWKALI